MRLCPRGVKAALEELCVEDRPCPPGWLPAVRIALDMLAAPLGIRRMRRSEQPKADVKHSDQLNALPQAGRHVTERAAFVAAMEGHMEPDVAAEAFDRYKARYERERFRLDKSKDKA
jgi:hypothetical protein